MSSLEYRQCPGCKTVGNWRRSRARGFIEKQLLPWLRLTPYRCTICRRKAFVFGDRRQTPNADTRLSGSGTPPHRASSATASSQDDEDFRQLIAELKRSEASMEQDKSR